VVKKTLDEQGDYKYYMQRFNSSSYRAYAIPKKIKFRSWENLRRS